MFNLLVRGSLYQLLVPFFGRVWIVGCICIALTKTVFCAEESPRDRAYEGVKVMMSLYDHDTGLWKNTAWWSNANVLTTIIRYCKCTRDRRSYSFIENTFRKASSGKFKNFLNEFYDDEGWWGIAWIEAYELTRRKEYLDMSVLLFRDMTSGWTEDHEGGLLWKKDETYKAAIANSLFTLLALRLHHHGIRGKIHGKTPLEWAHADWEWFLACGMLDVKEKQVCDGLQDNGRLNRAHWTYNQGMVMAVLIEWFRLTNDRKHLELAMTIADETIRRQSDDGILREMNEPNTGVDGAQFKGVFVRYLVSLYEATNEQRYRMFLERNARSVWINRNPQTNMMGIVWSEPTSDSFGGAHCSALDVLIAHMSAERIFALHHSNPVDDLSSSIVNRVSATDR